MPDFERISRIDKEKARGQLPANIGGSPVRDTLLSYGRQSIDDSDLEAVVKTLKGDFLTQGPTIKAFEDKIAHYVGSKYAVAFNSGTAALHGACFAGGIEQGDEVIVPPMSFAATANCVLYCGGTPVFVDVEPETFNLDPDLIRANITEKTKAIIPVHFAGQPVDLDKIQKIASEYDLLLIEDAAHALGSEYKGKKIGAHSNMTEFSFHPVKPITTGEGGMITTDDEALYQKLCDFRTHGITRDIHRMTKSEGPWYYEQTALGYNYRITDIQCALGISQLSKLDGFIQRRREIAAIYSKEFSGLKEIITPVEKPYSNSGWHIYVIRLNLDSLSVGRKDIFMALKAENIGVNVHYLPIYLHPYYKKLGYEEGICPIAEKLYHQMITLPIYPSMTDEDVADVIRALYKVVGYYSK